MAHMSVSLIKATVGLENLDLSLLMFPLATLISSKSMTQKQEEQKMGIMQSYSVSPFIHY